MKKLIPVMILLILLSGCATMGQFLGEPEIKLKGMAIDSLDLEGITFRCDYVIKNPYPLGISVSQIATDIIYEEINFSGTGHQ
jgi:LEA14-like dessication related protein